MSKKLLSMSIILIACVTVILSFPFSGFASSKNTFSFGMLLVGPYNDHGWSQAHFDAGKYVESKIPGSKMIYIDKVNPADRPGVTIPQLVDDMIEKGAKLIIANSDDMSDGITEAAMMHPDINFVHVSGDGAITGKAPKNLSNIMGRMEYGKMMAGFTAAMTTKTGKIGFLGPLINDETRRLAASCYLGAKYAWETVLKKDPADLKFEVTWIGFWFNIPGVTADPTQVASNFFDNGFDVVISGIDTSEALIVAGQKKVAKKDVFAIPYDYKNACDGASSVCLGVPYFNWGPSYTKFVKDSISGTFAQSWQWLYPDWKDINNPDTSAIGFLNGPALSDKTATALDQFISDLGSGKVDLFKGPLKFQDNSYFLKEGEKATDNQIWYMKKLLSGMTGQGSVK